MSDLKHYHFNITMTCGGCSGAVERVMKKLPGVDLSKSNVSLDDQTADIYTTDSYANVLEKIKKTGKKVNSAQADGEAQEV